MSEIFESFLSASSFNRFTVRDFAAAAAQYNSDQKELSLSFPEQGMLLPKQSSNATSLAKRRKSERTFSNKPLTNKQLGKLLQAFYAKDGLEHRTYPSAGATYCTEIFVALLHTQHAYNGYMCYYNATSHSLVQLQKAPDWSQLQEKVNITITGSPQIIVVFASMFARATEKYGERGGRFALLEAGAAMQQLALTIAASKQLKGVAAGGMFDNDWLALCGLRPNEAFIALGYLCGV